MARARRSNETPQPRYEKLLSQLAPGYYSGHILLTSVQFRCSEEIIMYPSDPLENVEISWQYSFEKSRSGFNANVIINNTIQGDEVEHDSIDLEIGYKLHYESKMALPKAFYKRFAYDRVLPAVWPYFRYHALELYFRGGLKWVVLPFDPPEVAEQ